MTPIELRQELQSAATTAETIANIFPVSWVDAITEILDKVATPEAKDVSTKLRKARSLVTSGNLERTADLCYRLQHRRILIRIASLLG